MRRTVVLYTDSETFGGAEVQLISLAERLDRREFHPIVVHSPSQALGPMLDRLRALHVEIVAVPPMLGVRHLGRAARLASLLRARHAEILHAHKSHPTAGRYGLLAGILAGCRTVVSTDQLRTLVLPARRHVLFHRALSRHMAAHIAVSGSVRDYLVSALGLRAGKIRVIPNWVEPDDFVKTADPAEKRRELGIPAGSVVIGMVARFHEQKGHLDLVAAAGHLVTRYRDLVFVLVGEGPTRDAVEVRVRVSNLAPHFLFLGQRGDVPAVLAAMDVLVLPSYYEGLPVSVLEAMAAGKPVVATAVDGTVDVIADGVSGLLVPPGDAAKLAGALSLLIEDAERRATMGAAGRERVLARFAAGPLVEVTERVYREGLG